MLETTESGSLLLSNDELRHIALWAADCAERALPIFEAQAPDDPRPREAVMAARAFARDGVRTAYLRKAGWAAHASAKEIGDPAAAAAARAACTAAGAAYTHPIATPHQINHILSPAAYAAHAKGLAASGEAGVSEAEIHWAIEQAPPEVRQIVRRMPGRASSKGQFHTLLYQLDAGLRR